MIASLSGRLKSREPGRIVVEAGGVGYEVFVPLSTYYTLPAAGMPVSLEIHQVVREDSIALYGFAGGTERQAFDLLLQVQHVGPKLALAILSVISPAELAGAVSRQEVARIDAVPGVGPKVAERVVRELRDKISELRTAAGESVAGSLSEGDGADVELEDAVSALVNLGYKPAEARRAVQSVAARGQGAELERIIRQSLAILLGEK